jgi:hypothetical protein
VNVETEEQSKQRMHAHSTNKPKKKIKKRPTIFWDIKGVLMVEFMQYGIILTPEVYCEEVKQLTAAGNS